MPQVEHLLEHIQKTRYCSFDVETFAKGGPHIPEDRVSIMGISFQPGFAYSIPLEHFESPFSSESVQRIWNLLGQKVFENPNITKVAFNAKHELKWVQRYGYDIKGIYLDSMLAKYLLDEEPPNDLKSLVTRFIPEYSEYENQILALVKQYGWEKVPLKPLSKYCCSDASLTFILQIYFERLLMRKSNHKLYPLYRNMLMMQTRVLAESELMGVPVNKPYLIGIEKDTAKKIELNEKALLKIPQIVKFQRWRIKTHIKKLINKTQEEIALIRAGTKEYKSEATKQRAIKSREEKISRYIAGELVSKKEGVGDVNFNSPPQMADLLFLSPMGFKFPILKYTRDKDTKRPTEKPSTDEETLLALKDKDNSGFIEKLLSHREMSKLHSTYMVSILDKVTPENKIHASFKIHGTVTGRLCISQDSIIRTDRGPLRIGDIIPKKEGVIEVKGLKAFTHDGTYQPITHAINKGYEEMYEVETEDGQIIKCTLGHKFLTDKGWRSLSSIINDTNDSIDINPIIWK